MIKLSNDIKKAIKKNVHYSEDKFIKDAKEYIAAVQSDRNWFIYQLLSAYIVRGAKDLINKTEIILKNQWLYNGYRPIPTHIKI